MAKRAKRATRGAPATPDWPAIRRAYEDPSVPLAETAAKAGVSSQKLIRQAVLEGWKARTRVRKVPPAAELSASALKPASLAARLKRLIAREIEAIEGEATARRDAAAKERDARRLSSLVRSLEKLKDMKASRPKAPKEDEDGDALRAELQRRLARLNAGQGAAGVSPEPERAGG